MSIPRLKICGLCDPAQAAAVAALGVDAVGVIGVSGSPRFLPARQRQALFAAVTRASPACLGVLVVADPSDAELSELAVEQGHQVVQLHGGESVERCAELRAQLDATIWKALRIRSPQDLDRASAFAGVVDALLLDAWVPGQLGGTGHAIPSEWLHDFSPPLPWWLAGGITPERVPSLLSELHPDGLDASSGVEDAPGQKNLERVAALLAMVRASARDHSLP